jgi:hypothetical protein
VQTTADELVILYKTLGGGWETEPVAAADPQPAIEAAFRRAAEQ